MSDIHALSVTRAAHIDRLAQRFDVTHVSLDSDEPLAILRRGLPLARMLADLDDIGMEAVGQGVTRDGATGHPVETLFIQGQGGA